MKVAILGGGSWGTALAVHLAKRHKIFIWEFFSKQAKKMQEERLCPLLPDTPLSENIFISSKMEEVLQDCEIVLLVVPSDKALSTMEQAKLFLNQQPIIICSKGFGPGLTLLSNQVTTLVNGDVYCLYGPTHAEEVCKGMFSGIVLAGGHGKEGLRDILQDATLKVELSDDIIGVQVAAALKNILAVFIGILDGMNLGDNAKAYVMTKGLEEIMQVGVAMGAKADTFYGLAGLGDMIVTCSSSHSRNRFVGQEVGKGRKLADVIAGMKMVAEGVSTVKEAFNLPHKLSLDLPIITGLYQILFEDKNPKEILHSL